MLTPDPWFETRQGMIKNIEQWAVLIKIEQWAALIRSSKWAALINRAMGSTNKIEQWAVLPLRDRGYGFMAHGSRNSEWARTF
jgi:hypothetical protein